MKFFLNLFIAVFFCSLSVYSQADSVAINIKHHSVYAELGGSSLGYSINYDYTFLLNNVIKLAVGCGVEYTYTTTDNVPAEYYSLFYITPEMNFMFGKKHHYAEIGGSFMNIIFPVFRVGYRYQRPQGGLMFRIAYVYTAAQTVATYTPYYSGHWAGISLGYTF